MGGRFLFSGEISPQPLFFFYTPPLSPFYQHDRTQIARGGAGLSPLRSFPYVIQP